MAIWRNRGFGLAIDTGFSRRYVTLLLLMISGPLLADGRLADEQNINSDVQALANIVRQFQLNQNKPPNWPEQELIKNVHNADIVQKSTELLEKLNRYRHNIKKSGQIPVNWLYFDTPSFSEVAMSIGRVRDEAEIILGTPVSLTLQSHTPITHQSDKSFQEQLYSRLTQISKAMDLVLGYRGVTPSDVHARAREVLAVARLLRQSQQLAPVSTEVAKPKGKLPNNALQTANRLMQKINLAQRNLWIKPIEVTPVPRRVIYPANVYDQLGRALFQLERIAHRLGLEQRSLPLPVEGGKNPDDVIQVIEMAILTVPTFSGDLPLLQYDRFDIQYSVRLAHAMSQHVLKNLKYLQNMLGIPFAKEPAIPTNQNIKPGNVYVEVQDALSRINHIRRAQKLGESAPPRYPLQAVTLNHVIEAINLLDEQVVILLQAQNHKASLWSSDVIELSKASEDLYDVFINIGKISIGLDNLMGRGNFSLQQIHQLAVQLSTEAKHLNAQIAEHFNTKAKHQPHSEVPQAVDMPELFTLVQEVTAQIMFIRERAGIFDPELFFDNHQNLTTQDRIYHKLNMLRLLMSELQSVLNLNRLKPKAISTKNVSIHDIYQELSQLKTNLSQTINRQIP